MLHLNINLIKQSLSGARGQIKPPCKLPHDLPRVLILVDAEPLGPPAPVNLDVEGT